MQKKPYLVDVPVKFNIWIRPECQRKQFEVIRTARPSVLFVQSDGGRNEKEWEAIYENRRMIDEGVDWECDLYKFYGNTNLGMYTMGNKVREFVWKKVDRCIFMEDDQIPSVDYFRFCKEMLDKYENDLRIHCVCGMNHLGVYEDCSSDYFFARQGSIWGFALWRRDSKVITDFSYYNDEYSMKLLKQSTKENPSYWKELCVYPKQKYFHGHKPAREFAINYGVYAQNQLQIIPKYNLISNVGATSDSAHADDINCLPRGIRKIFNMETYRLEFPLKHPEIVLPDLHYEKLRNDIHAYNRPIRLFFRRVEQMLLILRHKGIIQTFKKMSGRLRQDKER